MTIQLFSPPPMNCTHRGCSSGAIVHIRIEGHEGPAPGLPLNALLCPAHFLLWAAEYETWELAPHPTAFDTVPPT